MIGRCGRCEASRSFSFKAGQTRPVLMRIKGWLASAVGGAGLHASASDFFRPRMFAEAAKNSLNLDACQRHQR
jgi:hypothetical protein